ncbi:hypothetical protein AN6296.2 [Aspergillus nidulans FGSC A4]|uniref:Integral membrane protein (AFU_orthologue AFUA_2G12300) n=1 Tax=Emericella nidulans (strain FGSC A4 / ATCC 38163 / CBS 112.46 / NRRL 194 / M139) TaxID=227321 RepID=Q5AZI4_EMENI|nr:hypothetical protein [Aspergillus nidulans FGSC A4]EAA58680.1 hypothetical protein AN6296.2 [Aspergillus nidulans FGSC A4]CBF69759.1 TPA: integral membrane protein (AFU_orthologue; AFUA_2G12300) [Aspergillus nidulans FGSC A4]|eukprot:XP_663900.1 hypothetical protein AN6296.2 [Aspergillus nidulans FGSC A4]
MDSAALIRRRHRTTQLLQPVLRAYALGYLSSATPKIISCLRRLWINNDLSYRQRFYELLRVLAGPLRLESFPTFCAALVGGSTLLPILALRVLQTACRRLGSDFKSLNFKSVSQLIQFAAAFVSAWFSFQILNRRPVTLQTVSGKPQDGIGQETTALQPTPQLYPHRQTQFGGRTMDLTLFTFTRALDSMACIVWSWVQHKRRGGHGWSKAIPVIPGLADSAVFASSAAVVMWAWFYSPERLPRSYGKWIGEVAKVDERLIEALRRARRGIFVYGKDTGQAPLLESMCKDFGWPTAWGDPARTIPIPCEMVHMGCGPSCEKHAVSRFLRTFKFACATYIPLQTAFRIRSMKSADRTRLGPRLFSRETVTPQMWDSGLCVGAGCVMCGWSILVEHAKKRQEIALFVAPRAAATVLPRFYDQKYLYRERTMFAISAAVLLTCLKESPDMVRGVFGKIGRSVVN